MSFVFRHQARGAFRQSRLTFRDDFERSEAQLGERDAQLVQFRLVRHQQVVVGLADPRELVLQVLDDRVAFLEQFLQKNKNDDSIAPDWVVFGWKTYFFDNFFRSKERFNHLELLIQHMRLHMRCGDQFVQHNVLRLQNLDQALHFPLQQHVLQASLLLDVQYAFYEITTQIIAVAGHLEREMRHLRRFLTISAVNTLSNLSSRALYAHLRSPSSVSAAWSFKIVFWNRTAKIACQ